MSDKEMITMTGEDGNELSFYVLEQTKFLGNEYLLVTESPESEEVFLLKEAKSEKDEIFYTFVEDEKELSAVSDLFEELMEDVEFEME